MPAVSHIYVYPAGSNPNHPPQPLIANADGDQNANLYRIPAAANHAGIAMHQQYDVTISPMGPKNRGTLGTCNAVAPPHYVFVT